MNLAALVSPSLPTATARVFAIVIVASVLAALLLSVLAPALGMPALAPTRWYQIAM